MSEPFNKLSPGEAERLDMLAEEAAEVIQMISKIKRHGYNSFHPDSGDGNIQLLQEEIDDFFAVMLGMTLNKDPIDFPGAQYLRSIWERKLEYTHHQDEL